MLASCLLFVAVIWLLFVAMEDPRDPSGTVRPPLPQSQSDVQLLQSPSTTTVGGAPRLP